MRIRPRELPAAVLKADESIGRIQSTGWVIPWRPRVENVHELHSFFLLKLQYAMYLLVCGWRHDEE
jgi:hypothetical protein